MRDEQDRNRSFTRRAIVLGGVKGAMLSALLARLYYLQVVESERYQIQAEENRISLRLTAPRRGLIYDRFGDVLAGTRLKYRVLLVPEQTPNVASALDALADVIELTPRDRTRVMEMARRQPGFVPITVVEDLNWADFSRVNIMMPKLAGIHADVAETRFYPYQEMLAHVVGYVGAPNSDNKNDPLIRLPDYRVGRNGLEAEYDRDLRGRAGSMRVEVNAVGRVVREMAREPGEAGRDLVVTIDARLQSAAYESFTGESGSAILLDIRNGDILAMASVPGFDPDAFNLGLTQKEWTRLLEDQHKPLVNKSIAGLYPPGSTFKMMVGLAALESGAIEPDFKHRCLGKTRVGDTVLHCWKERGHGTMDFSSALQQSCDIYFYELAKRAGIDAITGMARRFGFGELFELGISGQKSGFLPSTEWARNQRGIPWTLGETMITGIGQGALLSTPLQLAVMAARLANGRDAVRPRLVRYVGDQDTADTPQEIAEPLNLGAQSLALVRKGMADVVNTPRGTAYRSRLTKDGMTMAGKTGTVQVVAITQEERDAGLIDNEDRPWRFRDHAMFVAYAPVENPKYAASIVVEHGGGGSTAAAPIAKALMEKALELDPLDKPVFSPTVKIARAEP